MSQRGVRHPKAPRTTLLGGKPMRVLATRIPEGLMKDLKRRAAADDCSLQDVVTAALVAKLAHAKAERRRR